MAHSNEEWAEFSSDPEASRRWDEYVALPELPESHPLLDKLLVSKGLEREDLIRVGAKWGAVSGQAALVFIFGSWRKYRVLASGARSSDPGATWDRMKVIRSASMVNEGCIIAEGETDGALLSRICPTFDIAILPAGAKHFTQNMAEQCKPYAKVYAGLDDDEAGNEGAAKILSMVDKAERLRPPANDWCEAYVKGLLDASWVPVGEPRPRVPVYTMRELLDADLGSDADNNWFSDPICPIGGEVVIHGPVKSLKSVLLMEMLRAIAVGDEFAGYIPFVRSDGPGRVLLFQFEVPPQPFQNRIRGMTLGMSPAECDMFVENMLVYKVASGSLPRLRISREGFLAEIREAVEAAEADVVAFDPVQRMTGGADINHAHELEAIFTMYEALMDSGRTVIYTHHNNKVSRNEASSYSMSGSQRFGADADSICSVYHSKHMTPDDNASGERQRNFRWDLRSGVARGRSMTARPNPADPSFMFVTYDDPITESVTVTTPKPAVPVGPPIT